jgi:hypothetical protein
VSAEEKPAEPTAPQAPAFEDVVTPEGVSASTQHPDGFIAVDRADFLEVRLLLQEQATIEAEIAVAKSTILNLQREIGEKTQRHGQIELQMEATKKRLGLDASVGYLMDERRIGFVPQRRPK